MTAIVDPSIEPQVQATLRSLGYVGKDGFIVDLDGMLDLSVIEESAPLIESGHPLVCFGSCHEEYYRKGHGLKGLFRSFNVHFVAYGEGGVPSSILSSVLSKAVQMHQQLPSP